MNQDIATLASAFTELGVAAAITGLVVFHQAAVELFKFLSRSKARHYYDALAYIVYGPAEASLAESAARVATSLVVKRELVPARVQREVRGRGAVDWVDGVEGRLVESFLLRSVGDDPVGEISDRDVENVARISRLAAPEAVRRIIELLDVLIARGTSDPEPVAQALVSLEVEGEHERLLGSWTEALRDAGARAPVGAMLEAWRAEFVEQYLPAELRARSELANAFRAAEYRYHRVVWRFSLGLALVEAGWLTAALLEGPDAVGTRVAVFVIAFGTLVVAPPGTKSLLDAVMGFGARVRR